MNAALPASPALRIVIADDEPIARRGLRAMLDECGVQVVAECGDGASAVRAIEREQPDATFLDVQMPEMTGFDVLQALAARGVPLPLTVFATAFDEFAVRAFEVNAIDYLVKPFTDVRVHAAVARLRESVGTRRADALHERLEALLATLAGGGAAQGSARGFAGGEDASPGATPAYDSRLVIPERGRTIVVPVGEVSWIEADDYYVTVHAAGRRHLWRESLGALEERLDPRQFVRVHRSAIVNVDRVREVEHGRDGRATVRLDSGARVPVSRSRRDDVLERLSPGRSG
jgi:two-component system LytT family response regulator